MNNLNWIFKLFSVIVRLRKADVLVDMIVLLHYCSTDVQCWGVASLTIFLAAIAIQTLLFLFIFIQLTSFF